VRSYVRTYGLDAVIVRSSNNYGPFQYPEKVIPLFVTNILEGRKVPLYGEGRNVRDWLYVRDNCKAIDLVLRSGLSGEVYNIGADQEKTNLELTRAILRIMGADEDSIQRVPDRLGHDLRYSVDSSKLRSLGWSPRRDFEDGLMETVAWYRDNADWWQPIKSGEFRRYYIEKYGDI
jgi:dTDP-glucose 4,6-dehydratase